MRQLYALWDRHYRPILLVVGFIALVIWLAVGWQSFALDPVPTFYSTSIPDSPSPTSSPIPFDDALLNAIYSRIQVDNTIPALAKKPAISLFGGEPTFAFPDNAGLVLQYKIFQLPNNPETLNKITLSLIDTGVAVTGEQHVPLDAIEVVFYVTEDRPWIALISTPPWRTDQLLLTPIDPEYIQKLKDQGLITPTLETY